MATIMEKDVLLEYVSFGYLVKERTEEADKDLKAMGKLWREILHTPYQEIDYNAMVETIKTMRSKYEQHEYNCTIQDNRNLA